MTRLLVLLALATTFAIAAPLEAQECEICHYWSFEACHDSCVRNFPSGAQFEDRIRCESCCWNSCGSIDDGHGDDNQCGSDGCSDPLLIDFGPKGLELTGAADGVRFDIDGNGTAEAIAWTAGASADAFLALDLNGNGRIDGAKELFGDATRQSPTDSPNGFLALAEWDRGTARGNEDGQIGPDDAIWPLLLLWVDRSHDGVSQAEELTAVSQSGLTGILLDYRESRRRDKHGNRYTYRSVAVSDTGRHIDVIDVFFAAAP